MHSLNEKWVKRINEDEGSITSQIFLSMISLNFLLSIKVMAWSSDIQCEEICISSSSREIKIQLLRFVSLKGIFAREKWVPFSLNAAAEGESRDGSWRH